MPLRIKNDVIGAQQAPQFGQLPRLEGPALSGNTSAPPSNRYAEMGWDRRKRGGPRQRARG